MDRYLDEYDSCGERPRACDPSLFLASSGSALDLGRQFFEDLAAKGYYFDADRRGSYIHVEAVRVIDLTHVAATSCWFDAGVVLGPGPGTLPAVINSSVSSRRLSHELWLESDGWRVGREFDAQDLGEGDQCSVQGS